MSTILNSLQATPQASHWLSVVIDVQKSPLLQKTAGIILKNPLLFAARLYFAYLHTYSLHVR